MDGLSHPLRILLPMSTQLTLITTAGPARRPHRRTTAEPVTPVASDRAGTARRSGRPTGAPPVGRGRSTGPTLLDRSTIESGRRGVAAARAALAEATARVRARELAQLAEREAELARRAQAARHRAA